MSRAPPLLVSNRFSILTIDEPTTNEDAQNTPDPSLPLPPPEPRKPRKPKWEKHVGRKFVINSLEEGPNSILIPVHLKTTDTMEESSTEALVDTGATGDFIDRDFVTNNKLPTRKLSEPVPVYNVDGSPNKAGSISEVVDTIMTYNGHSECILFAVT